VATVQAALIWNRTSHFFHAVFPENSRSRYNFEKDYATLTFHCIPSLFTPEMLRLFTRITEVPASLGEHVRLQRRSAQTALVTDACHRNCEQGQGGNTPMTCSCARTWQRAAPRENPWVEALNFFDGGPLCDRELSHLPRPAVVRTATFFFQSTFPFTNGLPSLAACVNFDPEQNGSSLKFYWAVHLNLLSLFSNKQLRHQGFHQINGLTMQVAIHIPSKEIAV